MQEIQGVNLPPHFIEVDNMEQCAGYNVATRFQKLLGEYNNQASGATSTLSFSGLADAYQKGTANTVRLVVSSFIRYDNAKSDHYPPGRAIDISAIPEGNKDTLPYLWSLFEFIRKKKESGLVVLLSKLDGNRHMHFAAPIPGRTYYGYEADDKKTGILQKDIDLEYIKKIYYLIRGSSGANVGTGQDWMVYFKILFAVIIAYFVSKIIKKR